MQTFAKFYLTENPDYIIDPDHEEKRIYYNTNDESYSAVIIDAPTPTYFYISDKIRIGGHAELRYAIEEGDTESIAQHIHSNVPLPSLRSPLRNGRFIDLRIWTNNKIVSFWYDVPVKYRRIAITILKELKQNPQDYIFELDAATFNPHSDVQHPLCLSYDAFISCADKGADFQQDPRVIEAQKKRLLDRKGLADIKMGNVNKSLDQKYDEVPGFVRTASPTYKRIGD